MNKFSQLIVFAALLLLVTINSHAGNICDTGLVEEVSGGVGGTGNGNSGIGGTGHVDDRGIGGTGHQIDPGIGGTGWRVTQGHGQSYIFGVVTGFASICVNGVEVHYDSSSTLEVDGVMSSIDQLAVGQVVSVTAVGRGQEVKAQKISLVHALSGPITKIDTPNKAIHVMNQRVDITHAINNGVKFNVGDQVKVSGMVKPNSSIHAARLDRVPKGSQPFVNGPVDNNGNISGVKVIAKLGANIHAKVIGDWNGNALVAKEINVAKSPFIVKPNMAIHVQGYINKSTIGKISVSGIELNESDLEINKDRRNRLSQMMVLHASVDERGKVNIDSLEAIDAKHLLERGGRQIRENKNVKDLENDKFESDDSDENIINERIKLEDDALKNKDKFEEELLKIQTDTSKDAERKASEIQKLNLDTEKRSLDLQTKSMKIDKIETNSALKIEKPEKIEKTIKVERPEKVEKPEKIEKPEKVERPEKVGRPERVEKPEKIERSGKD